MYRTLLIIAIMSLLSLAVSPTGSEAQGDGPARKLINSQGCKACHALEGDGGTMAGNFEEIRASLSRAEIRLQLVNQEQKHGKGTIPDFSHLSEEEIDALVKFLQP
ncbi:MAG: cytochrome c [Deltaproteobacteria bacterium]|nr:cytochrome c [Deltaproteobacteria bacterium]